MAQKSHPLTRVALALNVSLLLSGCPSTAVRPGPAPSAPATQVSPPSSAPGTIEPAPSPRPVPPPRENRLSPATQSLVTRAHALLAHGDMDGASSTLDRALRIEPSNPLLWVELGRLRLAESDPHQAESCARKALALAGGDRAAQGQAGHLLVDALRAQGRNPEAHAIEMRPYMH